MKTGSSLTNLNVEISDSLAPLAHEAERALSALFHAVKEAYGERAAFSVADRWLHIRGERLAKCGSELPNLRNNTVQSITCSLAPCTERGKNAVATFPSEIPGQVRAFPTITAAAAPTQTLIERRNSATNAVSHLNFISTPSGES